MKMSEIIDMRKNGATYQEIADAVGMSKQWVSTIILKHSPELKGTRGSALRRALDQVNRLQAEIERLQTERDFYKAPSSLLAKGIEKIKSEAVKEFAKRLKAEYADFDELHEEIRYDNLILAIDNLVKEMTEQSVNYESSKTEQ